MFSWKQATQNMTDNKTTNFKTGNTQSDSLIHLSPIKVPAPYFYMASFNNILTFSSCSMLFPLSVTTFRLCVCPGHQTSLDNAVLIVNSSYIIKLLITMYCAALDDILKLNKHMFNGTSMEFKTKPPHYIFSFFLYLIYLYWIQICCLKFHFQMHLKAVAAVVLIML